MTIFGTAWSALALDDVQRFLDQADDEPLLWEAKGTKLSANEVRRQVCGFANSHDGGYLILGAETTDGRWQLAGVEFPDEPVTWVTNVVTNRERGVRPLPDFDVKPWEAPKGHVAVVRVSPTSTPPCLTHGTLYERLPGKTQTLQDPQRLAGLYARGDQARRDAEARADRAAQMIMRNWLEGAAGVFRAQWVSMIGAAEHDVSAEAGDNGAAIRFAVGVAATGNPPNIAGRLFRDEFAEAVWHELRERPFHAPEPLRQGPDPVTWSQDALTWRHQPSTDHWHDEITVVRAMWDGAVAVGQKVSMTETYPDAFVEKRVAAQWQLADDLVRRLGGFGDVYVTVLFAGGRFPHRPDDGDIVMRRGPLLPGVDEQHVASLGRELMRSVGNPGAEP